VFGDRLQGAGEDGAADQDYSRSHFHTGIALMVLFFNYFLF
jgi:hypothetical protein